ncbi:MAG: hypothetical protein LBU85_08900 [Treponema sp.]|jgi:hypothetical protein|nr:hypothetical protein [Treponema sp.]
MGKKTTIYAATKSAKERLAKGEYKRRCAKGCACASAVKKNFGNTKPEEKEKV